MTLRGKIDWPYGPVDGRERRSSRSLRLLSSRVWLRPGSSSNTFVVTLRARALATTKDHRKCNDSQGKIDWPYGPPDGRERRSLRSLSSLSSRVWLPFGSSSNTFVVSLRASALAATKDLLNGKDARGEIYWSCGSPDGRERRSSRSL
jgi:hypothetical protein